MLGLGGVIVMIINLQNEVDLLRKYVALKEKTDQVVESLKQTIKDKMNKAGVDEVIGENFKVTYKEYTMSRVDTKALKEELPDIAEKFSVISSQKRLLVK